MIDLFNEKRNMISWQSGGAHTRKGVAINSEQVLETYNDAIDEKISIEITDIDKYYDEEFSDFDEVKRLRDIPELLSVGTHIVEVLYRDYHMCVVRLYGGYVAISSADTDDFVII